MTPCDRQPSSSWPRRPGGPWLRVLRLVAALEPVAFAQDTPPAAPPHGRDTAGQTCAREHVTWATRAREQVTHHHHRKSKGTTNAASLWEDGRGGARRAVSRRHRGYGGGDDLYGQRREGELYGGHRS